ncbi:Isochorismatase-like protein [Clohesyomyces aquaticus]|uniref:Isochorismatase-like protein n=1 Tax=Clohesyomyces aquaticus TaxID=1231657 RepID=A0A1Y2A7P3_9PLEO|nr:Isochorismatase-like protein [Clohesyomyces aquaticus]
MSRTGLFVIDIQADMASDPSTEIPHASRIRDAATQILAKARTTIDSARAKNENPGLRIVFVQHEEQPEEGPLVKGTMAWELVFKPREGEEIVGKTTRDTFESNPGLADRLREDGVGTVVAFGIQSEACVRSTCKGALKAGFKVLLLRGAHSTYDGKGKGAVDIEREVEEELGREGVEMVDWEGWEP